MRDVENKLISEPQLQVHEPVNVKSSSFYFDNKGSALLASHYQRHADVSVVKPSFLHGKQVHFTNQAIHSSALYTLNFEKRPKKIQVKELLFALEVTRVVPFHDLVFHLANATQVAGDLLNLVVPPLLHLLVVVKKVRARAFDESGRPPFNRARICQALH